MRWPLERNRAKEELPTALEGWEQYCNVILDQLEEQSMLHYAYKDAWDALRSQELQLGLERVLTVMDKLERTHGLQHKENDSE